MTEEESKPKPLINEYRDAQNRVIKREVRNKFGELAYTEEYSYGNNSDKPVRVVEKDPDGNIILSVEFFYDDSGRKTGQTVRNAQNKVERTIDFEYGEDGKIKREVVYRVGKPGYQETVYDYSGDQPKLITRDIDQLPPDGPNQNQ